MSNEKNEPCIFSISTTNDIRLLAEHLATEEKRSRSQIYEIALIYYYNAKNNGPIPS